MNILKKILEEKKEQINALKKRKILSQTIKNFINEKKIPIIAEIKKKSPITKFSRNLDVVETAKIFQNYGACALSILTDKNFNGSLEDLRKVAMLKEINIPILRKDFIIDEIQIYESFFYGADAILLIASILKEKTKKFLNIAKNLNLECIVEIHDKEDLKFIDDAKIIGINTRNLKNFEINLEVLKISKNIEKRDEKIVIGESGIINEQQVKQALKYVDGFLIGTSISENFELLKSICKIKI